MQILFAQHAFDSYNGYEVSLFVDELANEKIISLNGNIKSYARDVIEKQLITIAKKYDSLSEMQQKQLLFYLQQYDLLDSCNIEFKNLDFKLYKNNYLHLGINPFGVKGFGSDSYVDIKPIWGIRYYTNNKGIVRHTWGGGSMYMRMGKHISGYANVRDNYETNHVLAQPTYFTLRQAGNYKKNNGGRMGGDYSEMRGGLIYKFKYGKITIAKDNIQWGANYHGSNIFSGLSPSFGMIKLNLKPLDWFTLDYVHGWLSSEVVDSVNSYYSPNGKFRIVNRPKFIAANMLSFRIFRHTWFSAGNSIVYADMPVQPAYLVPFLFYKSVDHTINHAIDNQNSQMFASLSSRAIKHVHLYGTFYIDELNTERIGVDSLHNFISYKAGVKISGFPVANLSFITEFTHSNPIVYKHRVPTITYATNTYRLGHYMGDNSRELYWQISYMPHFRLRTSIYGIIAKHANEYEYIKGSETVKYPVMQDITFSNHSFGLQIKFTLVENSYLYFQYQHANMQGYDVDSISAETYLKNYIPKLYRGITDTYSFGFNLGF